MLEEEEEEWRRARRAFARKLKWELASVRPLLRLRQCAAQQSNRCGSNVFKKSHLCNVDKKLGKGKVGCALDRIGQNVKWKKRTRKLNIRKSKHESKAGILNIIDIREGHTIKREQDNTSKYKAIYLQC